MPGKNWYTRLTLALIMILTLTLFQDFLRPDLVRAADRTIYFPETGHSISGKFLDYWEKNGGLMVYGYPITDPAMEVDPETGKTFLTQWFERNRFELHPENAGTRYEILLGLLGKDLQRDALQLDPVYQPAKPKAGATFFPETSHNLEGAFLIYWRDHGGLERFGYPISEARSEGSYETGKVLWTQWFERARFEFDPRNQPPYNVQLGLLGVQIKTHTTLKSNAINSVWQKKSNSGLLYGPQVKGVDGQNNIYVTNGVVSAPTSSSSSNSFDVVQRYTPQGQLNLTIAPGDADPNQLSTIIPDVAIDKPGNSYLIVPVVNPSSSLLKIYDNQGHLLRKWTIKDIVTAEHVTVDGTGNIYISGNWTVKKYDQQGNLLATVLTYPENQFQNLIDGLTTDGQNNLLVAVRNEVSLDKIVNRILRFDSQAKALGQWDVNVPGQDLVQYEHLAVDSQGNVFVAPYFGSFVAKFSAQGQFITKWTGASDLTFERDIQSLALDTQGNILLSLANQSFILKLDSQGKYLARLAAPGDAEFKCPNSLAWIGNALYASDSFLGKVLKFDANGQFKGLIAVPGSYSEGALTGLLTNGQNLYLWKGSTIYRYNAQGQAQGKLDITLPSITSRVAIDGNEKVYPVIIGLKGGVYLADRAFDRILALVVDREGTLYVAASQQIGYSDYFLGLFSTPRLYKFKAGQPGYLSQWSKDGTADEEFRSAVMTLDTQNNLYLLDSYLGRVQKFDKEGKLLAKWSNADLKNISAFQIDETGHLYGVKGCDIVKITLS